MLCKIDENLKFAGRVVLQKVMASLAVGGGKGVLSAGHLCEWVIATHRTGYHVHGHKAVALRGVGYVAYLGYHAQASFIFSD